MPQITYLTIYQPAKINIKKYTCNNILNKQTIQGLILWFDDVNLSVSALDKKGALSGFKFRFYYDSLHLVIAVSNFFLPLYNIRIIATNQKP